MSKDAKRTEIPPTAVRLDVARGKDDEAIKLSLAAVEVLACLSMKISGDYGAKKQELAHDICQIPLFGFRHECEWPGWAPTDVVKAAIAELHVFFARPEIIGQRRALVVGHDPDRRARKQGQSLGYSLSGRADIWTQGFVGNLTPEGCKELQS